MTSNIGSKLIVEDKELGENTKKLVITILKDNFKPEFINRVDDIIVFKSLNDENIRDIIKLMIDELNIRLKEQYIKIEFTDRALEEIIHKAYDSHYGARPLRRYLQKEIETNLAKMILKGEISEGNKIIVDFDNENLIYKKEAN